MSNITVDLKVIEVTAPMVARALNEPVALTIGGLNLLWHRCWSLKTDTITAVGLAGIFGPENIDARIAQLVDAGFLSPSGQGFRVKGAERYLRIKEGNSKGGHASKSNLIPGGKRREGPEGGAEGGAETQAEREPSGSREQPSGPLGSSPITDHRSPITEHHVEDPPPLKTVSRGPLVYSAPVAPSHLWTVDDFFAWAQSTRQGAGWVGEPRPRRNLSTWWSEVTMTPGMEIHRCGVDRLRAGFIDFAKDLHWRKAKPPAPFEAFMARWRNHVPPEIPGITAEASS